MGYFNHTEQQATASSTAHNLDASVLSHPTTDDSAFSHTNMLLEDSGASSGGIGGLLCPTSVKPIRYYLKRAEQTQLLALNGEDYTFVVRASMACGGARDTSPPAHENIGQSPSTVVRSVSRGM